MASYIRQKNVEILVYVGIWILRILIFLFDVFTFPLYFAYQRSWSKIKAARKNRASLIESTSESIIFEPVEVTSPTLERFLHENIKTMVQVLISNNSNLPTIDYSD